MTSSTSGLDNKTENNQRQLHWLLHYFSLFFYVSHDKAPCPEPSTLACCEKEAFVSVSSRKTSSTFSFPPSQTGGENLPLCPGLHRRAIRHDSTGHHKVRESEWKYGSSRSEPTSLFCEQRVWENQCILQDHDLISEAVTPPRPIPQFYCLYWTFRWNMFIKFTIWSRLRAKFIHSAQCRLQHSLENKLFPSSAEPQVTPGLILSCLNREKAPRAVICISTIYTPASGFLRDGGDNKCI